MSWCRGQGGRGGRVGWRGGVGLWDGMLAGVVAWRGVDIRILAWWPMFCLWPIFFCLARILARWLEVARYGNGKTRIVRGEMGGLSGRRSIRQTGWPCSCLFARLRVPRVGCWLLAVWWLANNGVSQWNEVMVQIHGRQAGRLQGARAAR